jgi:thiol-disulfide isomerase/thioredoxin
MAGLAIGLATGFGCAAAGGASPRPESVPIIRNDYGHALVVARTRHVLLVVDAWAPWCPPCRLFHDEVLGNPRLERFQTRYVFATIDTDRPSSASFNRKYAQRTWPTLRVIDPLTEEVVATLHGAPDYDLFAAFLNKASAKHGQSAGELLDGSADRVP